MTYDEAKIEKQARARANLPIEHWPLGWAVLGLVIAVIGIVIMQSDLSILIPGNPEVGNIKPWIGLGMILGGVIATTIITDRWHKEMSLRNLGKGLRTLDALDEIAKPKPNQQTKHPFIFQGQLESQPPQVSINKSRR
jgi:hypothetical protein